MKSIDISLERIIGGERIAKLKKRSGYAYSVDIAANVSYSFVVGMYLDASSGATPWQSLISRGYATMANALTGGPYGKWRDAVHRFCRVEHAGLRIMADIVAFNTFQVPVYASAIAAGQLFAEGRLDMQGICEGAEMLLLISPAIGPTMGYWMNKNREFFGLETSGEKAQR